MQLKVWSLRYNIYNLIVKLATLPKTMRSYEQSIICKSCLCVIYAPTLTPIVGLKSGSLEPQSPKNIFKILGFQGFKPETAGLKELSYHVTSPTLLVSVKVLRGGLNMYIMLKC